MPNFEAVLSRYNNAKHHITILEELNNFLAQFTKDAEVHSSNRVMHTQGAGVVPLEFIEEWQQKFQLEIQSRVLDLNTIETLEMLNVPEEKVKAAVLSAPKEKAVSKTAGAKISAKLRAGRGGSRRKV